MQCLILESTRKQEREKADTQCIPDSMTVSDFLRGPENWNDSVSYGPEQKWSYHCPFITLWASSPEKLG